MMNVGICIVILVSAVGYTSADWYTTPEWAFQAYINSDFEMMCNDSDAKVMNGDMLQWYSPKGDMIMEGDKYTLKDENDVKGIKMMIKNVQHDDKGVYICMVSRNNVHRLKVNRGLNLFEPMYRDMLDKYRYNIMVGGIAAAALFVPLVVMCIVYRMRFRTEQEKEQSRRLKMIRKRNHSAMDLEAGPLPQKGQPQINVAYEEDQSTKL